MYTASKIKRTNRKKMRIELFVLMLNILYIKEEKANKDQASIKNIKIKIGE